MIRARAIRALVLGIALAATSCSGTGYTYVTSTSTGTFFKVPDSWKVYDKKRVLDDNGPLRRTFATNDRFVVRFDAAPNPSLSHHFITATYPIGLARVRSLGVDERDTYSLQTLRNEIVPVDQVASANSDYLHLLAAPKELTHGGLRGAAIEYTVSVPGTPAFSIDQIGFVDAKTERVWMLLIGCKEDCYRSNLAAIHRVIDSWTVEEK